MFMVFKISSAENLPHAWMWRLKHHFVKDFRLVCSNGESSFRDQSCMAWFWTKNSRSMVLLPCQAEILEKLWQKSSWRRSQFHLNSCGFLFATAATSPMLFLSDFFLRIWFMTPRWILVFRYDFPCFFHDFLWFVIFFRRCCHDFASIFPCPESQQATVHWVGAPRAPIDRVHQNSDLCNPTCVAVRCCPSSMAILLGKNMENDDYNVEQTWNHDN